MRSCGIHLLVFATAAVLTLGCGGTGDEDLGLQICTAADAAIFAKCDRSKPPQAEAVRAFIEESALLTGLVPLTTPEVVAALPGDFADFCLAENPPGTAFADPTGYLDALSDITTDDTKVCADVLSFIWR